MAQHDGTPRPSGPAGQGTTSGAELGRSFEAQTSSTFGGDLGRAFEEHNSSREEWERERHSARRRILWIGGFLLLVVIIAIVFFTTKPKSSSGGSAGAAGGGGGRRQQGPAAITVGQSSSGNSPVYVNALGTVTPIYTVTVYSQITGRVLSVHYREGQIVRKGDPLVDVDPQPYRAQLAQAEGQLQHDQGVLAEAKIDLARYQAAFARNAIARQQLEDQEQAVVQAEGTVQSDEGTVAYDKVQLSYCHIVAPISGKVGLRLVDPGNTVFSGTGSTLVVITQLSPITAVFNVAEDELPQIQQQLKGRRSLSVDLFDRSDDKKLASGRLSSLDNQIDTTTGTLKFRATVPNSDNALYPNQFVNARLLVKTLQNVVLVPSSAIQQNGTQAFVYLVHPAPAGSANQQPPANSQSSGSAKGKSNGAAPAPQGPSVIVSVQNVTVLTSNDQVSAVTGLQPGQQVATSGFDRLENGAHAVVQQSKAPQSHGLSQGAGTPTTGSESQGNGDSGSGTNGSSSSQGSGTGSGSGGGKGGL